MALSTHNHQAHHLYKINKTGLLRIKATKIGMIARIINVKTTKPQTETDLDLKIGLSVMTRTAI